MTVWQKFYARFFPRRTAWLTVAYGGEDYISVHTSLYKAYVAFA